MFIKDNSPKNGFKIQYRCDIRFGIILFGPFLKIINVIRLI